MHREENSIRDLACRVPAGPIHASPSARCAHFCARASASQRVGMSPPALVVPLQLETAPDQAALLDYATQQAEGRLYLYLTGSGTASAGVTGAEHFLYR